MQSLCVNCQLLIANYLPTMTSNPEIRSESTTAPPKAGVENNAAEHNSALTVELSPAEPSANAAEKTSVLTAAPLDYESSQTTANAADATVVRNRNDQQEKSSSHSSSTEAYTDQKPSNDGVIIVNNGLIDGYIPTRLGNYQIVQKIGAGGMGNIFLATDVFLDREVAIKILLPKYQSTELQERFIVEAKASAKLHHDNIVTIYSYGETNDLPFFAMEYIPGSNLRSIVDKTGVLSIEDTLSYAIQISSALEHINDNGIVHRDIKPSNVLITNDGTVKVIDLGLAKDYLRQPDDGLTQTGVTLGTFDYISPEQANDPRNVDIRADIYSLGCTMFFMLVGKPPFAEKNRVQKIVSHQVDVTPDIRLLRPKIPERLADIVMRCMEKNPDNRYKNPQELSRDLYIAAEEQGMRPSRFSLSKWYLPSKSRLRVWKDRLAWAIPIVLLIVGVWILNCFWQPDQRQAEFLPESPGLKRSDNSVNANGRPTPIFGAVKKGKVLDFDSDVQSFPPSLEPPAPNGNVTPPTPVAAEDQTPAQSDSAPSAPESIIQPTTVSAKVVQTTQDSTPPANAQQEQPLPDSSPNSVSPGNALQDNTNQSNPIHSVKLETD